MEYNNDDLDKQNEGKESQVYVPQDAQGIVLAFLPGRVVAKFRSVCKFWRDCVEEPSFVDRHLNNAFRFHQSIACFTSLDRGLVHMYTFDPTTMNFRSVELVFSNRFHISVPCNGLVCAYDLKGDAEVLNPITRKHLRLPVSELKSRSFCSEYFVGFVHSTKEYKVVSVRHRVRFLTLEICTVGTLSWRTVRESAELLKTTKAVIVNDGMYWLLLDEASSSLSREILMLNLTDEKFSKIATPDAVKDHVLELFEGEGKLLLLSTRSDGSNNTVSDIWVADLTHQDWVHLETLAPRVPVGMSPIFMRKMKIFIGNQKRLICVDLLDGTVSYIDMPSGESLVSCGMFVESFAPAVTGLMSSAASPCGSRLTESSSADPGPSFRGTGSPSTGPGQPFYLTGWPSADLEQSFKRAKRTINMEWKTYSKLGVRGLVYG
ncbi:putative F-box protein At2g02030 [Phragmites australis]|uniref:putative F-box protein At2g02030 n=1 Tax=Phragmites australis TaxID=29695 RepID=UPI002D79E3CF|nr:putative F-box protein At2g02030 [Phragmites australis]